LVVVAAAVALEEVEVAMGAKVGEEGVFLVQEARNSRAGLRGTQREDRLVTVGTVRQEVVAQAAIRHRSKLLLALYGSWLSIGALGTKREKRSQPIEVGWLKVRGLECVNA
jgi:hypothetical protein